MPASHECSNAKHELLCEFARIIFSIAIRENLGLPNAVLPFCNATEEVLVDSQPGLEDDFYGDVCRLCS
jgi:hypothetical protein